MLDIELTNLCNMQCRMCPTGQKTTRRPKGYMSLETLESILRQAAEYHTPIRFIRWGEPTMHPKWLECIRLAKSYDLMTHMNTNGLKLGLSEMMSILDSHLDSIKFSLQGVDAAGYETMRGINAFDAILERVGLLFGLRNERNLTHPFIQIGTTITNESQESVERFVAHCDSICDAVYVGKTRDLDDVNPVEAACECPEAFDKLSIDWDGTVTACCGDYDQKMVAGNAAITPLRTIWWGAMMEHYRDKLRQYRHNELALCRSCARSKMI